MKINLPKSIILLICLFLVNGVFAQNRIMGIVVDDQDQPIIGANILIKGTTQGVTTDQSGNFVISVPSNATLVVSFIGYVSQEVSVGNRTELRVKLAPDALSMEDVVVVGYGTQRRVNLTGAVAAINVDENLTNRALPNLSSSLAGLIPGLAVTQSSGMAGGNDDASLLIRGLGTVNNSKPLIVVDGMPDVDMNRINANDVESISVLKDAAAAAIYGSRAANGVVLITTKTGKSGGGKSQINFFGAVTSQRPTARYEFVPDYPMQMTLTQYSQLVANQPGSLNISYKNGTIDQWMALAMVDPLRYPSTDWFEFLIRTGTTQTYNLSASGANDLSSYFMSAGIIDNKALQIRNDLKRYNFRLNYEAKVRRNMQMGARFDANWTKLERALERGFNDESSAGGDIRYAIAGITPYDPVSGRYGGVMAFNEDTQAYNPLVGIIQNATFINRQELNGIAFWDWNPVKGLVARVDYGLNYYNSFSKNAGIPTRAYNFQTDTDGTRWYITENAGVSNTSRSGYKTLFDTRLNYNTNFGSNHDLGAMFVYSEEFWYDRYLSATRRNRIHPSLSELDAALPFDMSNSGYSQTEGLRSFIGRVNYIAFEKYLFEANFRADGSSKFVPGRQFGYFPSASFGWRFSQEEFVKSWSRNWLTNGKLRISYGSLGNNTLGVNRTDKLYDQQDLLANQNYVINGQVVAGLVGNRLENDRLSWEKTNTFNLGLDLGFLRNRLTVTLDYYNRLTSGMIRTDDFSLMLTGAYQAPSVNIGNLRNNGIETNIIWQDKVGDWSYSANFIFFYNRTNLETWNTFLNRGATSDGGQVFINMPYHFVYTYQDKGIAQTWEDIYNNPYVSGVAPGDLLRRDKNGDGKVDGEDRVAYVNRNTKAPTTNYSLQTMVSWKGFDLVLLFQGAAGRWAFVYNNFNSSNVGTRNAIIADQISKPWSWENRNGGWTRRGGQDTPNRTDTSFWLDHAAYLRFKNLQIGYTVPKRTLSKIGISFLRVYFSADNLATITNFRLLDPEKEGSKNDVYPLVRSLTAGVNLTF